MDTTMEDKPRCWAKWRVTLLLKAPEKTEARQLHPIGVVSGLQKLRRRSAIEAARGDIEVGHTDAYAFKRGASVDKALIPLLLAAERAKEWVDQMVVATLDVKAAFPSVRAEEEECLPHLAASDGDKRLPDMGPLCGPKAGGLGRRPPARRPAPPPSLGGDPGVRPYTLSEEVARARQRSRSPARHPREWPAMRKTRALSTQQELPPA